VKQVKKSVHFRFQLIDWLEDAQLCQTAVEAFPRVLSESHDILSSAMHADIKIMYRQRFFLTTLPKLVQCFHQVDSGEITFTSITYTI